MRRLRLTLGVGLALSILGSAVMTSSQGIAGPKNSDLPIRTDNKLFLNQLQHLVICPARFEYFPTLEATEPNERSLDQVGREIMYAAGHFFREHTSYDLTLFDPREEGRLAEIGMSAARFDSTLDEIHDWIGDGPENGAPSDRVHDLVSRMGHELGAQGVMVIQSWYRAPKTPLVPVIGGLIATILISPV